MLWARVSLRTSSIREKSLESVISVSVYNDMADENVPIIWMACHSSFSHLYILLPMHDP